MPIRMVAADLDGTLLRGDKSISPRTADALSRCRAQGVRLVFATARPLYGISAYMAQVAVDAVIVQNGAAVYADGALIASHAIPEQVGAALYNRLREAAREFACSAQTVDQRYMNRTRASFVTAFDAAVAQANIVFEDDALPQAAFNNISIRRFPLEAFRQIMKDFPALRYYTTTGEDLIDIHSAQASKWNAIETTARHYGISTAEVAAFGDDYNDIEMLRKCGIGVATANAIDEVKRAADAVCVSNEEDGVARWLDAQL